MTDNAHRHYLPFSLRLDRETLAAVQQAIAGEGRTASDWVRRVLRKELRQLGLLPEVREKLALRPRTKASA